MKKKIDDNRVEINGIKGIKRGDIVSAMIPVDRISPVEWNPNEMSPSEFSLLKQTIVENGFVDPVAVIPKDDGINFLMNSGEHRWKAATELGYKEIPCEILYGDRWQDEELQRLQAVRFNVIHGKMNPDKFLNLYNRAVDKFGKDKIALLMGYTSDSGIKKIIKSVSKEMKESLPPDMAKQFEEKAKEARSIGDIEKIIQHLFQEHGESIKYNFMVFAWGGKEHIYISMNKEVHQAMKDVLAASKAQDRDMNDIIGKAIMEAARSLEPVRNK